MKKVNMSLTAMLLILFSLMSVASADVIVQKDAIGPVGVGVIAIIGLLSIGAAIVVIWVICFNIIKAIRNKNVSK